MAERIIHMIAVKLNAHSGTMETAISNTENILDFCHAVIPCDMIEIVSPIRLPAPYIMIVDEEGMLDGKHINGLASLLYGTDKHHQPIVGDALIMRTEMTVDGQDIVSLAGLADAVEVQNIIKDAFRDYLKTRPNIDDDSW